MRLGEPQRGRDLVTYREDALRSLVDRQAVALPFGERAMRLHRAVQRALGRVPATNDDIRFGHAARDVTTAADVRRRARDVVALDSNRGRIRRDGLPCGDG